MIWAMIRDNETQEKLLNRFKKAVHNSRVILKVRATKFHKKPPTKRLIRIAAIKRESYRAKARKDAMYN